MEKPAVKQQATTAGKSTKRLKKYIASAGAGMAFLLLCAFSPKMQAEALTPPAQETKTVTVTEKIPFETTYVDLPNTYRGYTELVSEGVMGERQVEAQVIYEGDQVVRVVSIKTTETGRPVNRWSVAGPSCCVPRRRTGAFGKPRLQTRSRPEDGCQRIFTTTTVTMGSTSPRLMERRSMRRRAAPSSFRAGTASMDGVSSSGIRMAARPSMGTTVS